MSPSAPSGETFGVVVPVYRGAEVVGRSLASLARQVGAPPVRVVVAVNDGDAATLQAAVRAAGVLSASGVVCSVIETAPGRSRAIAAAERLLPRGPRLYLDQDAVLSTTGLRDLARALAPGTGTHFAAPVPLLGASRSALVRRYYRVWAELPYVRDSPVTMGAYAVSTRGRTRWADLPPLHSDDKFVRLLFEPSERAAVPTCTYEVLLPRTAAELVRARRRYRRGNAELAAATCAVGAADLPRHRGVVTGWLRSPGRWTGVATFLAVHAATAVPRVAARVAVR